MFETKSEMWQSSVFSPTLFNVMCEIGLELEQGKNNTKILIYADNVKLWTNNARVTRNLNWFNNKGNKIWH